MELTNTTPIVADAVSVQNIDLGNWIVFVTAKATYCVEADGSVALDRENPVPLYEEDEGTDFGLLPRDNLPRWDDVFEVILLGQAHAPGGNPVQQMDVSLTVGKQRRTLRVFGDRGWSGEGSNAVITKPQPFLQMPLTYERAFGGSCEVLIDRESPIDVVDPHNPVGRGLDPGPAMQQLAKALNTPKGYPKYEGWRLLPNVEDPRSLITKWEDAPQPASWATVPLSTALHTNRALNLKQQDPPEFDNPPVTPAVYHRAHPAAVLDLPPPDTTVKLQGVTSSGTLEFKLPQMQVFADYVIGAESGTLPLVPQMLVLLPEEMRFYLVYRSRMYHDAADEDERSMRIRIDKGWHVPPEA